MAANGRWSASLSTRRKNSAEEEKKKAAKEEAEKPAASAAAEDPDVVEVDISESVRGRTGTLSVRVIEQRIEIVDMEIEREREKRFEKRISKKRQHLPESTLDDEI